MEIDFCEGGFSDSALEEITWGALPHVAPPVPRKYPGGQSQSPPRLFQGGLGEQGRRCRRRGYFIVVSDILKKSDALVQVLSYVLRSRLHESITFFQNVNKHHEISTFF